MILYTQGMHSILVSGHFVAFEYKRFPRFKSFISKWQFVLIFLSPGTFTRWLITIPIDSSHLRTVLSSKHFNKSEFAMIFLESCFSTSNQLHISQIHGYKFLLCRSFDT
mgnify:CR=1 FL=1